ncbi:hypothetical protein BOTBODRAFT_29367 [Botryobasidium botryosum FD-172 SS1]|uniref:Endothelin-converting enzyme 1 n=1 Tax=Botryobasidium botryosum (strain FD-172 SS1) TaxID=930990 RepID=A0A067N1L5_BOTB1|nr:hypothetical protein BOTBODRAFT_29367 [Botryobasidium botryosum FD-172 SS1]
MDPRPPTDEESARLLTSSPDPHESPRGPSLSERVSVIVQEPLSPLSRILLALCICLLLVSSVFIGLFAGAEHRLHSRLPEIPGGGGGGGGHQCSSYTETRTYTRTEGHTHTSIATSTSTVTMTMLPPGPPGPTGIPETRPCLTPDCIHASAAIIKGLDLNQDPCEDFYLYANGGWKERYPVPHGDSSYDVVDHLTQRNNAILRRVLEGPLSAPSASPDQESLAKIRAFYGSCMDEETLDNIGSEPLLEVTRTLRKLLADDFKDEGIKIQKDDEEEKPKPPVTREALTAALAYLHSRDVHALFHFDVKGDAYIDPGVTVPWLWQSGLGLPSEDDYEDRAVAKDYTKIVSELLFALDEKEDEAVMSEETTWPPWPWPPWGDGDQPENKTEKAERLAGDVVKFEKRLAKAGADRAFLRDPIATYNPVNISTFSRAMPLLDFPTYLAAFTPRTFPSYIIVTYPPYLHELTAILQTTPATTVEAYLVARAGITLGPNLGPETKLWKAVRKLRELTGGPSLGRARTREGWCLGQTQKALGFIAGRFFAEKAFHEDSRKSAEGVLGDIVHAFKHSFRHSDWMDDETAGIAIEKASAINLKVGYPTVSPNTSDAGSIERYYSTVRVGPKTFFFNSLNAVESKLFRQWVGLGRPRNENAWSTAPTAIRARFDPSVNDITVTAGILQPPFFERDWPAYLRYGAYGGVAGHELTNAFVSLGRFYDQDGKLEPWWTKKTKEKYEKKRECFEYQDLAWMPLGSGSTTGIRDVDEMVADSGLVLTYRAWRAQLHRSEEPLLPGLDYTREQLFFISYAQVFAANEEDVAVGTSWSHRVEGTLRNIPEFAEAFSCPRGSKLNPPPHKRCTLW